MKAEIITIGTELLIGQIVDPDSSIEIEGRIVQPKPPSLIAMEEEVG